MQFRYKPEGIEPKVWEFRPYKLMSPEAELIEKRTGMAFADWARVVTEGSMIALRALLFVMLKRGEPTLKWEQLQFSMSEVDFILDDEEKAGGVKTLEAKAAAGETLTDDESELLLSWREELGLTDEPELEEVEAPEPVEDTGLLPGQGQAPPETGGDDPKADGLTPSESTTTAGESTSA